VNTSGEPASTSKLSLKLINILLFKNPERTVLGVLLGFCFSFCARLFSPALKKIEYINIDNAPDWGWVALGLILINLPKVCSNICSKPKINEYIDEISELIEAGNFSESEKRLIYRNLVSQCVKNVTLKNDFTQEFNSVQNSIKKKKDIVS